MPEGQFLGARAAYEYISDNGNTYLLTLDATLGGITGCDLTAATTATMATTAPKGLRPRVIYWQGVLNGNIVRKKLVCNASGSLYSDTSQALTIDGVAGSTTGRRGEKSSFIRLPAPAP